MFEVFKILLFFFPCGDVSQNLVTILSPRWQILSKSNRNLDTRIEFECYDQRHASNLGPNFSRWWRQSNGGLNVVRMVETLHNQCDTFHDFLPDGSIGCRRHQPDDEVVVKVEQH